MATTDKSRRVLQRGRWTKKIQGQVSSRGKLGRAVLAQAVHDILFGNRNEVRDSAKWIRTAAYDNLCDVCGVNPTKLKRFLADTIKMRHGQRLEMFTALRRELFKVSG